MTEEEARKLEERIDSKLTLGILAMVVAISGLVLIVIERIL